MQGDQKYNRRGILWEKIEENKNEIITNKKSIIQLLRDYKNLLERVYILEEENAKTKNGSK